MRKFVWLIALTMIGTITVGQTKARPKTAAKTTVAKVDEVKELRGALAAQQQQLEAQRQQMDQLKSQLQQLLDATQQANANSQNSVQQAQTTATQAQQSAAEAQRLADQASANAVEAKTALALVNTKAQDEDKKLSALSDLVGRFRFTGDIRLRGESFFQDCPTCLDRNRARVRVRFGLEGKLNEDFLAGFALATGSLGDPTTTNETFTNFFDRKTIGLDKGYITYNPVAHRWFSATGGKFAYAWQRTGVTGDQDINPEGFDVKLSFDTKAPVVKNFTVQAINYLFSEVSGGTDSYSLGGQVSSKLEFGPWTATPSLLLLKWQGTSALLQASAFAVQATKATDSGGGSIPLPGEGPGCAGGIAGSSKLPASPPCAFSANGMTNAVVTGADGKPRFLSGFFYADFILNNQIKTGWKRLPLNAMLEFEQNLDAASHPLDSKGNLISSLGSQDKAYQADISLGQTKNKNDVQVGYAWLRQEQDSVLASFAESDQRAPTNILQNRVYALWKLRSNTVAGFTWWHGRTLNTGLENNIALTNKTISKAGDEEPSLNRYQFDLIYTF